MLRWDEELWERHCNVGVNTRRLLSTRSLLQAYNTLLYRPQHTAQPLTHKTQPHSHSQPRQHSLERNYERLRQKPAIPGPRGPMGLPGPAGLPGRTGPMGPMVHTKILTLSDFCCMQV